MKKVTVVIVLALIVVLFGTVSYLTVINRLNSSLSISNRQNINLSPSYVEQKKFNLLVVGADASYQNQQRTDTLMIVSFDLTNNQVGVLSIPRDTRVQFPGYSGYHKINAAYAYGGLKLIKQTVEDQFQIRIDNYLQVDYQGFVSLVDKLEGVTLEVEDDLRYVDRAADLNIDIKAGSQRLTGEQALNYIRFRDKITGDLGRIKRQQKFLRAALKKVLNLGSIVKVPNLIKEATTYLTTDIRATSLIKLIRGVTDLNLDQVEMEMLPGKPVYISGISFWVPDQQASTVLINSLVKSKNYFQHQNVELVILNGAGINNLAGKAAVILSRQGYKVVKVGNADHFNYQQNYVIAAQKSEQVVDLVDFISGELQIIDNQEPITVIVGQNNWS